MKKFIKKTIAGLIAGVMAISSMPFTALANDYSEFDTMKSQMASFTAYQPSAHGSFSGDADYTNYEDHYKGLVYAEDVKDYSAAGAVLLGQKYVIGIGGSATNYSNLYFPTSVALYTGSNEITVPIMISTSTAQSGSWSANFRPHAGVISGDGLSFVNSTWNGKDEKKGNGDRNYYTQDNQTSHLPAMNFMWTINQTSYTLNTTASQGVNKNIDPGYGEKAEIFANKVKVTPSFDSDTTVTSKSYTPSIRFYVSVGDKGFDSNKYIDLTSSDAVTVINYQPYLNKLATVKYDVASMDATKYTVDSVKAYVVACNEFLNIDPSDSSKYSYSTDTSAVDSLVEAMNKAMTDYDLAKKNLKELPQIGEDYIESYKKALAEAEAKVNEADKYTADSIDALQKVIADVKAKRDGVKTNADLDALTTSLLTAISNLVQTKFTVEFVKIDANGKQVGETVKATKEYGQTFEANAEENVKGWIVYTDNGATMTRLNTFDQIASVVITKDAKIEAYLSGEKVTETSSKVTFYGRHNQVVAIRYVAENQTLEDEINKVPAPQIPFYNFVKWDVSKTDDGKGYTVKAVYTCDQVENDKCTVHFGDWHKAYAYDNYVYLPNTEAGKKYALYSDAGLSNVLTVLDGVDFYAPKRSNIYVGVYDGDDIARVAVMGTFSKIEGGTKSAYYNCKFNLPEGATAIEWGVELKYTDKNGNVKYAPLKAELKSKRNEYTSRLDVKSASVTGLTVRAYVVYSVNNNPKKIVRSAEETVTFNA